MANNWRNIMDAHIDEHKSAWQVLDCRRMLYKYYICRVQTMETANTNRELFQHKKLLE